MTLLSLPPTAHVPLFDGLGGPAGGAGALAGRSRTSWMASVGATGRRPSAAERRERNRVRELWLRHDDDLGLRLGDVRRGS